MAATSERSAAIQLMTALAAAWLLTASAAETPDPTGWTPDQCQCDAEPAVVALCNTTNFYPADIVSRDWETVGNQYYDILTNDSLSEEQRQAQYVPLMTQSGLDEANFTLYATKYAALKRIPSAETLKRIFSYCSVQYNNVTDLMPCQCTGGGMAEMTLTLESPPSDQFEEDPDNYKQQVLAVLEEKLQETLGLWYTFVSINSVSGSEVNVHVTFSTLSRGKIEERFSNVEDLLGQAGELSLTDSSKSIELGSSTLKLRVLTCSGPVQPTSDLPAEASPVSSGEVLAGARARFTCPEGQKFSTGGRTVTRQCTGQEQLEAGTGDPLTCVDETVTVVVPETTTSSSGGGPCQCDAEPAVVALCNTTTFYPADIVPRDWETVGNQYYDILTDDSLSEEQRQAQYVPLMTQSGLDEANFTLYATKYAALKRLPSTETLKRISSYCSVQYNNANGLMPCQCTGGGMAELTLTLENPPSIQFEMDPDNAKQQVLAVLEEKLQETLGLWYTFVSINSVSGGEVTVHVTFSTLSRGKIEERFSNVEDLLGQAGEVSLTDGSKSIELGSSTLKLRVLTCSGPVQPTSDLPAEASPVSSGEVLAGARARFTCPEGQKFSTGGRTVTRQCTGQEQLEAGTGDPLTCVDETVSVAVPETTTSEAGSPKASSLQPDGPTQPVTTYEPDHYEEINVEWNDGKSITKLDPNKPNLLMRITIPAATVSFVLLIMYLLCTRPESCMCNACGGGKLSELK